MITRIRLAYLNFLLVLSLIVLRLAYWQLVQGPSLRIQARDQYLDATLSSPDRGEIITADGYTLVGNRPVYTLGAYTPALTLSQDELIDRLLPHLTFDINDPAVATDPARSKAKLQELAKEYEETVHKRLANQSYATLARGLTLTEKESIASLGIAGLTFDENFRRSYPEASMAAELTGFVGQDNVGNPTGYFGLEGYYDHELGGRVGVTKEEKDAGGNPLLLGSYLTRQEREGSTLRLYLERGVQYLAYTELKRGIELYGAKAGEVVIMDPKTGGILAMVSLPTYDPARFNLYDPVLYKNPVVASSYEPGSTFKVLVMAAALDAGKLELDEHCNICNAPLQIDKYSIKTWNGKYHPDSTPEEILVNSDNVGMVWIEQKLGGEVLRSYLDKFGIGQKTGIDLFEEIAPPVRDKWGDIDYATASFGQGLAVTSIEMVKAVGALANGGVMMQPHVVQEVLGKQAQPIVPKVAGQVVSSETAQKMTKLMIASAEHGDAKWTRIRGFTVAGKTGTAQIPVAGHYDTERTIASFIGFAPAVSPRFVMLVKLEEPTSSPWGSETAAPLWFDLARRLLLHYNIPPDK